MINAIISETGLKTKEEKIFAICFAEEKNNFTGIKKKNAEPKGNVGNKHEHMVHVKKYITMKFYERCPTSCVKEMQMSFLIY